MYKIFRKFMISMGAMLFISFGLLLMGCFKGDTVYASALVGGELTTFTEITKSPENIQIVSAAGINGNKNLFKFVSHIDGTCTISINNAKEVTFVVAYDEAFSTGPNTDKDYLGKAYCKEYSSNLNYSFSVVKDATYYMQIYSATEVVDFTSTISISALVSTNADLSGLALSSGTLSPDFAGGTTTYTASVPYSVNTMTVTPSVADSTAAAKVNTVAVTSGTASGSIDLAVGDTAINVVVTAASGATNTYTVTVTRAAASSNADLSGLLLSTGTLSPVFTGATTTYTASVSNAVSSMTVAPTVADSTATVQVNGSTVTSGTASGSIGLAVGTNTVTVLVTAESGATKTYKVTVTRAAASTNANLSGLSLSTGTLNPVFAGGTITYTASVSNAVSAITVTPTVADSTATVQVNGSTVTSGTASGGISLTVGTNTITVLVTAESGATKTYTITVNRAASSNADLSGLTLSGGTLSPVFAGGTTYTASVANSITNITVTPTVADSTATVQVNGSTVTSGAASGYIGLAVGNNTVTVLVTAASTATKSYTVTVTRAASSNADLSGLSLSTGTLSPAFTGATTTYTASVSNAVSSMTVTPTVADSTATVQVNGSTVTSGTASGSINLAVGNNTVTVLVTAESGATMSYTVTVNRAAASTNADLSGFTLSSGTLSPAFAGATTTYTASVANNVTSVTAIPTAADSTATVQVNGTTVTSGTASGSIGLAIGTNTVTVLVTAESGATKTYTMTVNRAASSNADLSGLTLSGGTLSPVFAGGTTYTASVANSITNITVTPTVADSTATVQVNGSTVTSGTASGSIGLAVGTNTVTVLVTAASTATKTYTITVTRAAASSNADLSGLTLSGGTLSPVFAGGTTYTAIVANNVTSITATPTVADSTATVQVNGSTITSGTASGSIGLSVGNNAVTVLVTAASGVTKSYTVTVTRAASSNADLSGFTLSSGTLSPTFTGGTATYTASVANSISSITVAPTTADGTATIKVNGTNVASGAVSGTINLNVGSNTLTILVTAESGVTSTYTITVTRAATTPTPTAPSTPSSPAAPVLTPTPAPVVEQITVDVKEGDTEETATQIVVERSTDTNGNTTDIVTYQDTDATETIANLKESGEEVARIVIPDVKDEVDETTVNLPSSSLDILSKGEVSLKIETTNALIDIPKESLQSVQQGTEEDLYFNIVQVKQGEQQQEITERTKLAVSIKTDSVGDNVSVVGSSMTIETNMPSTDVDITLPLTGVELPTDAAERAAFLEQLAVYIEHSDGDKELVTGEIVKLKDGRYGIKFHITKFSVFTIVKTDKASPITTTKSSKCYVRKMKTPSASVIKGKSITSTVANKVSSLTVKLNVSTKATWKLYTDKACTKEVKNKKINLLVGTNKYYVKVIAENGSTSRVYTLSITRKQAVEKVIIVATKFDFSDAFAAGVLAIQLNGEVVCTGITKQDALDLIAYIKKNYTKQDEIYIIGLDQAVYGELDTLLIEEGYSKIIQIGGYDKYETATNIADELKLSDNAKVILVNGETKPEDCEDIQKLCAQKGYAILYVKEKTITDATLSGLKNIKPDQIYILGDKKQISEELIKNLQSELGMDKDDIIRISNSKDIK